MITTNKVVYCTRAMHMHTPFPLPLHTGMVLKSNFAWRGMAAQLASRAQLEVWKK
jgi:hypothetical protein